MSAIEPVNKISVVIPVCNEQESLPELLRRTLAACQQLDCCWEILLVDDGSSDLSPQLITEAAQQPENHVTAILLNRNYGQHAAILAGFSYVSGDLVITLDADLQNPPEEIPRLTETARQGFDVVGTARRQRQDTPFRKYASRLINRMIQRATGKPMGDYGCMLRAYRRPIVDAMLACQERSTFIPLLANTFARHITEITVDHAERQHGESRYSLMRLISLMYDLITCLTTTPLRILSLLGVLLAASGFMLGLLLLLLRLAFGAVWAADGVFTLFAVLFIFTGAQFIGMGLLGEYIGRIYCDVRARPRYVVQRVIHGTRPKTGKESAE